MLQLYTYQDGRWMYWEAWAQGAVIMTHEGVVGQEGQGEALARFAGESLLSALERAAGPWRARGYEPLSPQQLATVVVQYRPSEGAQQAQQLEESVKDALDQWLARTGNGYVEGSAWRGTRLNVILSVVEPSYAVAQIVSMLRERGLLWAGARVAVEPVRAERFEIAWPEDFSSDFSMGR